MEWSTDPKMLEGRAFYKLGETVYDHHKKVLIIGILSCLLLGSLISLGPNWAEAWGEGDLESVEAGDLRNSAFASEEEGVERFTLLIHHPEFDDSSPEWQVAVTDALADFEQMEDVEIQYSWTTSGEQRDKFVHQDEEGFWAKNIVTIYLDRKEAKQLFSDNWDSIEIDSEFNSWRTGGIAIDVVFDTRIQEDLIKAELISGPLSLIILGIVFGTIVAAILPIGVAMLTVISAMGVTIWLSNTTDVTQYALNIITLIGIGVSVDYSLFMVYRFREELSNGRDTRTSTAMTVATAGKAVFFSGITVAIGLMGMLFFENTGLPSLGIGGTLAVSIAMVFSIVVLPAIMVMLGTRLDKDAFLISIPLKKQPLKIPNKIKFAFSTEGEKEDGAWARIANFVMERPWAVLIPTLVVLLGAGLPFLQADFSIASRDALPPDDETRIGFDLMDEKWPEDAVNAAMIVIDFDGQDPLLEENLVAVHRWMVNYLDDDRVLDAFGYALPYSTMNETDVLQFWQTPDELLDNETIATREYFRAQFLSNNITYLIFSLDGPITGEESRSFVSDLRDERGDLLNQLQIGENGVLKVAGFAAYSLDVLDAIIENLPIAIAFILTATIVLIFIQVRSVIIPIKAIIMNILSVSASFGMLVFVFQWGYGSEFLNFTPQPIETTNPVILFCIVFGLSMDYEVLMLSRIHEEWERTGDNTLAVANGLQKTGRLITGAAAIMVVVFSAFGLSSVVILKQIGFGLALAILLDATIVRALVVPATMRLMGKANWWSPKWLDNLFTSTEPELEEGLDD
tara:strand:- start:1590 stop:3977 length:2388 start_codon:yes stop_codon:yes gene_type:complete